MLCAVLARAGEEHQCLMQFVRARSINALCSFSSCGRGALVPYAVLAHASEEHYIGFVPFESCGGFVPS